jgi:hypothetical protein
MVDSWLADRPELGGCQTCLFRSHTGTQFHFHLCISR